jgi:hypothetical protein
MNEEVLSFWPRDLHHSSFILLPSKDWWVATVLPRALRFRRPLHHCNACDTWWPSAMVADRKVREREGGVEPPQPGL